jgi:uncharacterized protein (DUF2252 family)
MDSRTRERFSKSFTSSIRGKLDAPHWLWSSVVELASAHEAGYLEHCREYALA